MDAEGWELVGGEGRDYNTQYTMDADKDFQNRLYTYFGRHIFYGHHKNVFVFKFMKNEKRIHM